VGPKQGEAPAATTFTGRAACPTVPSWQGLGLAGVPTENSTPKRETFLQFDKSGDGKLNAHEVCDLLTSVGLPNDVSGIFARIDTDKNGSIEYSEFEPMWETIQKEAKIIGASPHLKQQSARVQKAEEDKKAARSLQGIDVRMRLDPRTARATVAGRELMTAARRGDLAVVRALLEDGLCDVNYGDPSQDFETPLHAACAEGHADVAQSLLTHGAIPEARNSGGWTPLHRSALWGNLCCAEVLVHGGADVKAEQVSLKNAICHSYGRILCSWPN